jgi:hypothetical protein
LAKADLCIRIAAAAAAVAAPFVGVESIVLFVYSLYFTIMSTIAARKSIKVSQETYDILARQGNVADTFEDVIKRLLKKSGIGVGVTSK